MYHAHLVTEHDAGEEREHAGSKQDENDQDCNCSREGIATIITGALDGCIDYPYCCPNSRDAGVEIE